MRLISFGGVDLPAVQGQNDLNATARSALVTLPGGGFDIDGAGLTPTPNRITKRFLVIEPDGIDDAIDDLLSMLSMGRTILRMVLRDETTQRQTWAKMLSVDYGRGLDQINNQPVQINWERNYPYWLATADEPVYLDAGEELDDGWSLDDGNVTTISVTAAETNQTINNTGGAAVPKLRIVITPGTGASITNIRIINQTTGQWVMYNGVLSDGDVLELETLTKTATLNEADAYSDMTVGEDQVDWLGLAIGNNAVRISAESLSGTTVVDVYWSKHYL